MEKYRYSTSKLGLSWDIVGSKMFIKKITLLGIIFLK